MNEVIANQTWNNFMFPDWVPDDVREQLVDFHREDWGRGPASWIECAVREHAPKFGERVRMKNFQGIEVEGRYIHAWNNIGRVIDDHDVVQYVGCCPFEVSRGGLWVKPTSADFASAQDALPFIGRR